MNNSSFVFISLDAVKFFEKPYFDGKEWHNLSVASDKCLILLTDTRADMLRLSVGRDEEPWGYKYSVYGSGDECYIPVYERTGQVDLDKLYPSEIISG